MCECVYHCIGSSDCWPRFTLQISSYQGSKERGRSHGRPWEHSIAAPPVFRRRPPRLREAASTAPACRDPVQRPHRLALLRVTPLSYLVPTLTCGSAKRATRSGKSLCDVMSSVEQVLTTSGGAAGGWCVSDSDNTRRGVCFLHQNIDTRCHCEPGGT